MENNVLAKEKNGSKKSDFYSKMFTVLVWQNGELSLAQNMQI